MSKSWCWPRRGPAEEGATGAGQEGPPSARVSRTVLRQLRCARCGAQSHLSVKLFLSPEMGASLYRNGFPAATSTFYPDLTAGDSVPWNYDLTCKAPLSPEASFDKLQDANFGRCTMGCGR